MHTKTTSHLTALASTAVLALATPAAADAACSINAISGTWLLQVRQKSWDEYTISFIPPTVGHGTCWFVISKNTARVGNLRIYCDRDSFDNDITKATIFELNQLDFEYSPWHQIVFQRRGGIVVVERQHLKDGEIVTESQQFETPLRCEWKIIDRNDLDTEYRVNFSPDMQTLFGRGTGYIDKHFGATEPKEVTFIGIRQ